MAKIPIGINRVKDSASPEYFEGFTPEMIIALENIIERKLQTLDLYVLESDISYSQEQTAKIKEQSIL